ncbi:MAG: YCF48-related protein [Bacteroidales bacterium]
MKKLFTLTLFSIIVLLFSGVSLGQTNWKTKPSGVTFDLKDVDFINEDEGIAVGIMGTVIKTTNGGETWTTIDLIWDNFYNTVQYIDEENVIIGGDQGIILYSFDGGENWDVVQESGQDYHIYAIHIDPESGHGIAGGSGNTTLWTEDWGYGWQYVEGGFMNNYNCACMAGEDFGTVIGRNAIFQPLAGYTMDGGQTWDGQPYYPYNNNTAYESTTQDCHFFTANDGFTVGTIWNGDGFITTEPNWSSQYWNAIIFPGVLFFGIDFVDNSYGVVVGGDYNATTNIFETYDGGLNWEPTEVQSNGNTMLAVKLIGNTGYAVGTFGEILKMETSTGIYENTSAPIKMYNYPNPTNERTHIFLEMNEVRQVNISLFDMTGKLVKKIYSGIIDVGNHTFPLTTSDLSSGIYQYTVTGEDMLATRKLIVE